MVPSSALPPRDQFGPRFMNLECERRIAVTRRGWRQHVPNAFALPRTVRSYQPLSFFFFFSLSLSRSFFTFFALRTSYQYYCRRCNVFSIHVPIRDFTFTWCGCGSGDGPRFHRPGATQWPVCSLGWSPRLSCRFHVFHRRYFCRNFVFVG